VRDRSFYFIFDGCQESPNSLFSKGIQCLFSSIPAGFNDDTLTVEENFRRYGYARAEELDHDDEEEVGEAEGEFVRVKYSRNCER